MLRFLSLHDHQQSRSFYTNKLTKELKNTFKNEWKKELFSDVRKKDHGNKLRTYRTFKTEFFTEQYLLKCSNELHRRQLARFRLSAHNLNIERLRYVHPRIPPEKRICNQCTRNECENEFHFILKCDKYSMLRNTMFENISRTHHDFDKLDEQRKFTWLCSNTNEQIIGLLGNFISTSFKMRNA